LVPRRTHINTSAVSIECIDLDEAKREADESGSP
jgi:hypothetical protein